MKSPRPTAAWFVVAAGFLCMMVAAGIGWYVFPVYLTAIQRDLGWSRADLSLAVSVWALAGGVFSPMVGTLVDRYGPRPLIIGGTLCQVVVTFLIAHMTALWQVYALFVLASLANSANTYLPVAAMIARWFKERTGGAMAVAMLGMAAGGLVMPIVANVLLERFGWRGAYTIFAYVLLSLLVPVLLWVRNPDAAPDVESVPPTVAGDALAPQGALRVVEALRTRSFWTLSGGDLLIGLVTTSVIVHMVAFTTDVGVSQAAASAAYGTSLAVNGIGIILFGIAADRLPLRIMMGACYGTSAIAMLFVFRLPGLGFLYGFAVLFGICAGGRAAMWPLALGECFGTVHLGSILGWLGIPFLLGSTLGPYLAGYIRDTTGEYRLFFLLCIALSVTAAALVSTMRNERRAGVF
jgi:MFS family permease